jgi:hypothetical protein
MSRIWRVVLVATGFMALSVAGDVVAQQPQREATPRQVAATASVLPALFFREEWRQTGEERDVEPGVVTNPNLELRLYGPTAKKIQIAPNAANVRQDPPNLWTGECTGPVAATLRDKNSYVDLTGRAKIRWATRSAGFHVVRPVLKLADGTWLIGDHVDGDGSTQNFVETEFSIASVRWLKLDIETVTTVHADRSQIPETGRWVEKPDLRRVDEVGFADLMPGSGHGWGGFVNVGRIEVYGTGVRR